MTASSHISPGGRRIRNGTPTVRRWYRLPTELADWLAEQSDTRVVAENVLVVRALEELRRTMPPLTATADGSALLEEATAALDAHGGRS